MKQVPVVHSCQNRLRTEDLNFIDKIEMRFFLNLLQKPWHQNSRTLLTYNMHMKILCNIFSQSEISHSNLTKHLPTEKLSICTLYTRQKT